MLPEHRVSTRSKLLCHTDTLQFDALPWLFSPVWNQHPTIKTDSLTVNLIRHSYTKTRQNLVANGISSGWLKHDWTWRNSWNKTGSRILATTWQTAGEQTVTVEQLTTLLWCISGTVINWIWATHVVTNKRLVVSIHFYYLAWKLVSWRSLWHCADLIISWVILAEMCVQNNFCRQSDYIYIFL